MPCSQDHFIPILDELKMQEDQKTKQNLRPSAENQRPSALNKGRGWGGRRPGAGAPKGNLNALKHGRTSRRQVELLEAIMEIPEARDALIELANRNRRQRKKAEEGYGVMMTRLLEKVAAVVHNQACPEHRRREDGQGQNNQEFLDFLNTATTEMRKILRKPSRRRRPTIKRPPTADA